MQVFQHQKAPQKSLSRCSPQVQSPSDAISQMQLLQMKMNQLESLSMRSLDFCWVGVKNVPLFSKNWCEWIHQQLLGIDMKWLDNGFGDMWCFFFWVGPIASKISDLAVLHPPPGLEVPPMVRSMDGCTVSADGDVRSVASSFSSSSPVDEPGSEGVSPLSQRSYVFWL